MRRTACRLAILIGLFLALPAAASAAPKVSFNAQFVPIGG